MRLSIINKAVCLSDNVHVYIIYDIMFYVIIYHIIYDIIHDIIHDNVNITYHDIIYVSVSDK